MTEPISTNDLATIFKDLTPIPQNDGPYPVCTIAYSDAFQLAMGYFRAIIRSDERSERALRLTVTCLQHNPANYTIWHYRRTVLNTLLSPSLSSNKHHQQQQHQEEVEDMSKRRKLKDLQLAASLGGPNPKNYQVWYHRHAILEDILLGKSNNSSSISTSTLNRDGETKEEEGEENKDKNGGDDGGNCHGERYWEDVDFWVRNELDYTAQVFEMDAKNYHAWSHRQWVIKSVNRDALWYEEKIFAHKLINEDPFNNSAWNHRWFVSHRGCNTISEEYMRMEADYAIKAAELDPYNESPWRYLLGLIREFLFSLEHKEEDSEKVQVEHDTATATATTGKAVDEIIDYYLNEIDTIKNKLNSNSRNADHVGYCTQMVIAQVDLLEMKNDDLNAIGVALKYTLELKDQDPIRKSYWEQREQALRSRLPK